MSIAAELYSITATDFNLVEGDHEEKQLSKFLPLLVIEKKNVE